MTKQAIGHGATALLAGILSLASGCIGSESLSDESRPVAEIRLIVRDAHVRTGEWLHLPVTVSPREWDADVGADLAQLPPDSGATFDAERRTVVWRPARDAVGDYQVRFRARGRSGGEVVATANIRVVAHNTPPALVIAEAHVTPRGGAARVIAVTLSAKGPTELPVSEGEAIVRFEARDTDGDAITMVLAEHPIAPYWAMLEDRGDGTADLRVQPPQFSAGRYPIDIAVSGGQEVVTYPFVLVVSDEVAPRITSLSVDKPLVGLGQSVSIRVVASEPLPAAPTVTVGTAAARRVGEHNVRTEFLYSYEITGDDPEGVAAVVARVSDRAGNARLEHAEVTIDRTEPRFEGMAVRRDPRDPTALLIDVRANEALRSAPTVLVAQDRRATLHTASADGRMYRFMATHPSPGAVHIAVAGYDQAGNFRMDDWHVEP